MRLTADEAVELIGGAETYVPVCRGCHGDAGAVRRALSTGGTKGVELARELEACARASAPIDGEASTSSEEHEHKSENGSEGGDEAEASGSAMRSDSPSNTLRASTIGGSSALRGSAVQALSTFGSGSGSGPEGRGDASGAMGIENRGQVGSALEAPRTPAPPSLPVTPTMASRSGSRRRTEEVPLEADTQAAIDSSEAALRILSGAESTEHGR